MRRFAAILLLAAVAGCAGVDHSGSADVLITNGRIVDGTGNNWFRGDVAVKNGKITHIGKLAAMSARRVINAQDKIVAPGFIDVHGHIEFGLFERPTADNYIHNGVTTVITGNCGGSADSLKDFFARIDRERTSINIASLVGHNTVRRQVMGLNNREATAEDLQKMQARVDEAMRDGAVGLSTGLIYLPGVYSSTAEVVALAKTAAAHHGVYASHIRNEGSKVVEAINEALDIGRAANMPVQISHFKVSAPANWGRANETLAMIQQARRDGLDVTIDQYPYTASSTQLAVLLPDWAREGGDEATKARLLDPAVRPKIAAEILASARASKRPDFAFAVVARHAANAAHNGMSIAAINQQSKRADSMEAQIETIMDILVAGGAQMVFHGMHENDVKVFMAYPFNMVGTDGGVQSGRGMPHPRSYGTHARVLAKYVREEKIVTLEDAIRRMTSLAAQKFRLTNRGLLRVGYAADLVIFDEKTVTDRATYENPHQFSAGFDTVLVNGVVTLDSGRHNGGKAGVALRGPRGSARSNTE